MISQFYCVFVDYRKHQGIGNFQLLHAAHGANLTGSISIAGLAAEIKNTSSQEGVLC
jgi:hypothetical protein